jgi:hypothetical protein
MREGKRIAQKAKAWGNVQDRLTWALSERGKWSSTVWKSENVMSIGYVFVDLTGFITG